MFIPVFLYSILMSITPGPNNTMLAASGASFGFRKTLPLIAGILLGFFTLLILGALGLNVVFEKIPVLQTVLKISGSVYLVYLSLKIMLSRPDPHTDAPSDKETQRLLYGNKNSRQKHRMSHSGGKPPGLLHGALLQFLNPKAFMAAITAMSVYTLSGDAYLKSVLSVIIAFGISAPIAAISWTHFGSFLGSIATKFRYRRTINIILGLLTVASVVLIGI